MSPRATLPGAVQDRLFFPQVREDPRAELCALRPGPDVAVEQPVVKSVNSIRDTLDAVSLEQGCGRYTSGGRAVELRCEFMP